MDAVTPARSKTTGIVVLLGARPFAAMAFALAWKSATTVICLQGTAVAVCAALKRSSSASLVTLSGMGRRAIRTFALKDAGMASAYRATGLA
jgi:hypothetical protein